MSDGDTSPPAAVAGEIVVLPRGRIRAPARVASSAAALAPWRVEAGADGVVRLGEHEVPRDVARALWARLGDVLGEADRASDVRAWQDVETWLDAHFEGAHPCRGMDLATRGEVRGQLRRDRDDLALLRVGVYLVAHLRPRRSGKTWEGAVHEYWPGSLFPQSRATARRVRVRAESVDVAPRIDEVGRVPPRGRTAITSR